MKYLACIILALSASFSFGQTLKSSTSVGKPKYDTTSIDIVSKNSFYFCNYLYAIPRDCDKEDQSNCCSYSSQVHKQEVGFSSGQIACYDGTSLNWQKLINEESAKQTFDGYFPQIKKQMKSFKQEPIKLFVCEQEVQAYKISYKTMQGHSFTHIIFYGTINKESIFGQLALKENVKSSKELSKLFQQLVEF